MPKQDATLASLEAENAELRAERERLSEYFRDEAPSDGFEGDVEGASPIETAIKVLRRDHQRATQFETFAEQWQGALEAVCTILDVGSGLNPTEAVEAVQKHSIAAESEATRLRTGIQTLIGGPYAEQKVDNILDRLKALLEEADNG